MFRVCKLYKILHLSKKVGYNVGITIIQNEPHRAVGKPLQCKYINYSVDFKYCHTRVDTFTKNVRYIH